MAPTSIAPMYSQKRAHIVVAELQRAGVDKARVSTVGHGKRVSTSAALRRSSHPNSSSAKKGFGWAEVFVHLDGAELPPRPDYYQGGRSVGRRAGAPIDDVFYHEEGAVDSESDERESEDDGSDLGATVQRRRSCVIS